MGRKGRSVAKKLVRRRQPRESTPEELELSPGKLWGAGARAGLRSRWGLISIFTIRIVRSHSELSPGACGRLVGWGQGRIWGVYDSRQPRVASCCVREGLFGTPKEETAEQAGGWRAESRMGSARHAAPSLTPPRSGAGK